MPINMVQRFVVEVSSIELLEQYLLLVITTALNSYEELAVKVVDREEKYFDLYLPSVLTDKDKHFPVILISGWYLLKKEENYYFYGYEPWKVFRFNGTMNIAKTTQYIKKLFKKNEKAWEVQFKQRFGSGYTEFFNEFDGSVGLGYELRSCGGFPECLSISIVHIYYGK